MNEKLLTIYWNLLVILLFGDAVVGVIWLFRYNILVTNLRSDLKIKLNNEYGFHTSFEVSKFGAWPGGRNFFHFHFHFPFYFHFAFHFHFRFHPHFLIRLFAHSFTCFSLPLSSSLTCSLSLLCLLQQVWDRIQREFSCCGVDGPFDFNSTLWIKQVKSQLVPRSCCRPLDPSESLNLPASGLAAGASSTTLSPSQQGQQQSTKSPFQSMALQSASLQAISALPSGVTFKKPFTAGHRKKRSSEYTHQDEWSHNAAPSTPVPSASPSSSSSSPSSSSSSFSFSYSTYSPFLPLPPLLASSAPTKSININTTQDKRNLNHDSLTFHEQMHGYGNYLAMSSMNDDTIHLKLHDTSDSGHKKLSTQQSETGWTRHRRQSFSAPVKGHPSKWLASPSHHYYYHHKLPHQNVQRKEESTELTEGAMQFEVSLSPHPDTSHRGHTGDTFTADQLALNNQPQLSLLPLDNEDNDGAFNSRKFIPIPRPRDDAIPDQNHPLHEEASVDQGHHHQHHHNHHRHRHRFQVHGRGNKRQNNLPQPRPPSSWTDDDVSFKQQQEPISESMKEAMAEGPVLQEPEVEKGPWHWVSEEEERAPRFEDEARRQMQLKTSHFALIEKEAFSTQHYEASAIKSDVQGEEEQESAKVDSQRIWSANGDIFDSNCVSTYSHESIHVYGCYDSIFKWIQRTTDTLCVLGFCVISFLKVCFACILRYEIKEMIQKIQSLKAGSGPSNRGAGVNSTSAIPGSGNVNVNVNVNSSSLAPATASRNHSSTGAGQFAQDLEGSFPPRGSIHQATKEKTLPSSSFSLTFGASCTSTGHQHPHQQNSFAVTSGHEGYNNHQPQHRRSLSGQSAGRRSSVISVTEKSSSSTDAAQLQPTYAASNCNPSSTTSAGQSQLSWQVGHSVHHQSNHQSNNTHQHYHQRQESSPEEHPHHSPSQSNAHSNWHWHWHSQGRLVTHHWTSALQTGERKNSLSGPQESASSSPGQVGPTSAPTKTAAAIASGAHKRPQATTITTTAAVNPCVS